MACALLRVVGVAFAAHASAGTLANAHQASKASHANAARTRAAPSPIPRLTLKLTPLPIDEVHRFDTMQNTFDPIIAVEGLRKVVRDADGELTILDDIGFVVMPASSVAIVGASGSGKSTLLGLLAGLDTASAGTVRLFGEDLTQLDEDRRAALRSGRVGFVFQSFQLMPHLTALENVMLPLELRGETQDAIERAKEWLQRVGLGARMSHYPKHLSGGEQQRVALARAFVTRPDVLFADEPTGSLDAANGEAVINLMFDLNRETGATLVLVTHDIDLASRCATTITIEAGRIRQPSAAAES